MESLQSKIGRVNETLRPLIADSRLALKGERGFGVQDDACPAGLLNAIAQFRGSYGRRRLGQSIFIGKNFDLHWNVLLPT